LCNHRLIRAYWTIGHALAETLQHATIVAGNFKWNMTDGFKEAIRARASR